MFWKRTKRRGKIVNLLVVTMLIVGTIPLVISGYNLISYNANILTTDQQLLHLQICKSVADEISLFLQSCLNTVTPLEKSLELGFNPADPKFIFYDSKTRELLNALFHSNNLILNIRAVYLDSRGVQAGYKIREDSELAEELRSVFYQCLNDRFTCISKPYYSEDFNQIVFVIGRTLLVNNKPQGVVTVVFSMAHVYETIYRIYQSGNTTFLLDSRGNIILHPEIRMIRAGINLSKSPIFQELKKLRSHAISTIPFTDSTGGRPVKMIGTVYMIPESDVGWGIVVQTPEDVANVVIQNMQRQTVYWILLSIILALLMSYLFSQRISIPIQMLTGKTLSITKGNFNERVDVHSNNELGILAENFNMMAEWIENYIEQLKQAAEENRQLFLGIIRSLAAAIDAKDPYTRGHSERVTRYSELIARGLGLSAEEIERIQIAALLHDVGKIGISDAILQKPSLLTDEEYAIMKQHPELGGNIMSQIQKLESIIPGMRYHHESLDGSGYPGGLKGEQIPLAARIIGVADAFDAMTTERPYQKPFTAEAALEKIRSMAGRKFDERVVDALVKAYLNGYIRLPGPDSVKQPRYVPTH
jgi:HD-GYP domain-containing protein (c-di-GMP phosphodiesterase class II)